MPDWPAEESAMPLKTIVARLGGDLYDGGRRASIPAPGHGRHDRSISLLAEGDRILIHSFGEADWREARDHLRDLGLMGPAAGEASSPLKEVSPRTDPARRLVAQRIWADGRPLGRTLGERHCRLRGVGGPLPGPEALRYGPQTPISAYREGGSARPALLAGIIDPDGELSAVEITYLAPGGRRAERLRLSRKMAGTVPPGSAVRLAPAAPAMLVAEGVFTTLSATRRFGLPGWALTSAGNLRQWRAPPGVERVLIAADRGAVGEAAAEALRQGLAGCGIAVEVALPPAPFGDWNEAEIAVRSGEKGRRKGGLGCV
jgi:putative DNA primase/helicase